MIMLNIDNITGTSHIPRRDKIFFIALFDFFISSVVEEFVEGLILSSESVEIYRRKIGIFSMFSKLVGSLEILSGQGRIQGEGLGVKPPPFFLGNFFILLGV